MGEHDALGEACGAGGVLHVAHVVLAHLAAAVLHLGGGHGIAQAHGVLPGVAALLLAVHGDDIAQHRQTLGVQLARQAVLKLGAQLLDDANIIRVLVAVDHHQGVGVGLAQQVLGLVDLIGGVHRNQHRADFGGGPEGDVPLGHVGGPNSHMVPLLHPHGDEGPGKLVHVIPELGVGAGVIQLGVLKAELVGELLDHAVQHIGEGGVDEGLLGPDILACMAVIVLKLPFLHGEGGEIVVHIVGKLGEHHAGVGELLGPALHPFQGDVPVIADIHQGVQHLGDGQVALAHHAVLGPAVHHDAVLDVDILDEPAQVLHCLPGGFPGVAVGVVHIPQCRHGGHVHLIQQFPQALGIGVDAVGLHQQAHVESLGNNAQQLEGIHHKGVVHLPLGLGIAVAQHPDVGGAQLFGQHNVLDDFGDVLVEVLFVFQGAASGQARNLQAQRLQFLQGLRQSLVGKGTCVYGEDVLSQPADFNAAKAQVFCHGVDVGPGKVRAGQGGKTDFHGDYHLIFISVYRIIIQLTPCRGQGVFATFYVSSVIF